MLQQISPSSTNLLTPHSPAKKAPILIISLKSHERGCWLVEVFRRERPHKTYKVRFHRAQRLTQLARQFDWLGFCDVKPEIRGWSMYVDKAVYPPPPIDFVSFSAMDSAYNLPDAEDDHA